MIFNYSSPEGLSRRNMKKSEISCLSTSSRYLLTSALNNHLRHISLTSAISKVAEDFVVGQYAALAIMEVIDPYQFGGISSSSATHAIISMIHTWSKATDETGFDLIDHRILANKTIQLSIPLFVKKWVIVFLMFREQRVKLFIDCFSDWSEGQSGVPQDTKL